MSRIRASVDLDFGRKAVPTMAVPEMTRAAGTQLSRVTSPRNRGDVSPYNRVNRDRPVPPSSAPPGARQIWQLWRAREEVRDLALRSAILGGYLRWVRMQALGSQPSALHFDRLTREQQARLADVLAYLRREWRSFQTMRGLGGGTNVTLHQMAGSILRHVDVDGDCFVTWRELGDKRRVYDLHPGDALSEAHHSGQLARTGGNRILGVEVDGYNRAVRYDFRHRGLIAPLNVEYSTHGGQTGTLVPAPRVLHIRERSSEVTAVRGWPLFTNIVDDIARLDEWYGSLIRSANARASVMMAMKRMDGVGGPGVIGGDDMGVVPIGTDDDAIEDQTASVASFQEFVAKAGDILELDPGWDLTPIPGGAPTAQEAMAIAMLERRLSGFLRCSPATLLGDYKGLSFSGGQLAHLQEAQSIIDRQTILAEQFYAPVYEHWLMRNWMKVVGMFAGAINPDEDLPALMFPEFKLRKYQVIDKSKTIKPSLEAWNAGAITYAELREELGFLGVDTASVIAEWQADRKLLGLPESPSQGGGGGPPGAEGDADDADEDDDPPEDDEDEDDEDEDED